MTENVLCINNMVRNLYHASDINKIVVLHIMHLERFANVCLNRNNRLLSSLYPLNMSTAYCKKLPRILVSFCQTQIRVMGFTEREIFSGVHRTYRSIYYCSCTKHLNFNTPAHFPPPCSGQEIKMLREGLALLFLCDREQVGKGFSFTPSFTFIWA